MASFPECGPFYAETIYQERKLKQHMQNGCVTWLVSLKTFDYCIVPLKRSCPEATKAREHTAGCLHDHDLSTWVPFTCLSGLGCSVSINWSISGLQERSRFFNDVFTMRHRASVTIGLPDIDINYCLIPE